MVSRLLDVILSILALTLLSPLFVVVGAVIKMTSHGPVFFRQTRVGLHGREFSIVKFRTMTALTGAESGIFRPGNTNRCGLGSAGSCVRPRLMNYPNSGMCLEERWLWLDLARKCALG